MRTWIAAVGLTMLSIAGCEAEPDATCASCAMSFTDAECDDLARANGCASGSSYEERICSPATRGCRFLGCPVGRSVTCGAPAPDGGMVPTDGGATDAPIAGDVERCEAAAAAITCADADRQCAGRALGMYCATERADVLGNGVECLRDFSDATGCRSFSDRSGADACIRAALEPGAARVLDLANRIVALCGAGYPSSVDDATYGLTPPLPALSDESLAAIDACVVAALSCAAANRCLADRYPAPFACFAAP